MPRYIVLVADGEDPLAVAERAGVDVLHHYTHVLNGFAVDLTEPELAALRADPAVRDVRPDRKFTLSANRRIPGVYAGGYGAWGLERLRRQTPAFAREFPESSYDGTGVTAYILDTGYWPHPEFGDRIQPIDYGAGPNYRAGLDNYGHGTHVAGTIGGTHVGVAPGVQLRTLKVLDDHGSGDLSTIVLAIDWVAKHGVQPAVVNMSFNDTDIDPTADEATAALVAAGFAVAISSGNIGSSSHGSPYAEGAFNVGGIDILDRKAWYSNFGSWVDVYAPGSQVLSSVPLSATTYHDATGYQILDGTSMASPHVCGALALYRQKYPDMDIASLKELVLADGVYLDSLTSANGAPAPIVNTQRLDAA